MYSIAHGCRFRNPSILVRMSTMMLISQASSRGLRAPHRCVGVRLQTMDATYLDKLAGNGVALHVASISAYFAVYICSGGRVPKCNGTIFTRKQHG
jgi:hypothetical protein